MVAVQSFPSSLSFLTRRAFCPNNLHRSGVPCTVSAAPWWRRSNRYLSITASQLCTENEKSLPLTLDKSALVVAEAVSEAELRAAASLRVRSFYGFKSCFGVEDHKKYLADREFEALKERIAGKRVGFRRVSCINATLPLSQISVTAEELCSTCKFPDNREDHVVVGTLDLNQCLRLPDEITGKKPEGIGADFARAYLSNVCVAKELHQNGLGSALVTKSKMIAQEWGITDLYVHVTVDNEAAQKLYIKNGFIYENDEPAWQARFLNRPQRILLWNAIPAIYTL